MQDKCHRPLDVVAIWGSALAGMAQKNHVSAMHLLLNPGRALTISFVDSPSKNVTGTPLLQLG
jgi:hypothetical protein